MNCQTWVSTLVEALVLERGAQLRLSGRGLCIRRQRNLAVLIGLQLHAHRIARREGTVPQIPRNDHTGDAATGRICIRHGWARRRRNRHSAAGVFRRSAGIERGLQRGRSSECGTAVGRRPAAAGFHAGRLRPNLPQPHSPDSHVERPVQCVRTRRKAGARENRDA